jgi:segregation and condensation protein B
MSGGERNGTPVVQGELGLELGERVVETGGEQISLTAAIEALLFVAAEPVEIAQLAHTLELEPPLIAEAVTRLSWRYGAENRGLRLQERDGRVQLVSLPAAAPLIESFLSLDLSVRLSGPALETLSVIAYRQPVTRAQIEAIRGVDSSGVLRSLIQRGLIEEIGRLEVAGRPIQYGVTDLFLQYFGLTALTELPPLAAVDQELLLTVTQASNGASSSVSLLSDA